MRILISIVLIIAVAGGALMYMRTQHSDREMKSEQVLADGLEQVGGGVLGEGIAAAETIHRISGGFEPKDVTISAGETVSFVNDSDEFFWPASDVHPTHTIYSEFDPREPLAPGKTWSFTFDRAGTWEYHDHLRANYKGTITVEPVH